MKRVFLWSLLLQKRLTRRWSFWCILAAVPLLLFALGLLAGQDSGAATAAIYAEDASDPAAAAVLERLEAGTRVVRYLRCASEAEARSLTASGRADTAWILPADLSEKIDAHCAGDDAALIRVYTTDRDGILQSLLREKLFAALYPELAYGVYTHHVLDTLRPKPTPSAETLLDYYHSVERGDEILSVTHLDGSAQADTDYLLMPARGLLALLIMTAALASALYMLRDDEQETFVRLSRKRRRMLPWLCHLIPTLDTAVVAAAALGLAGLGTVWCRELLLTALYVLACVGFSELMRQLLPDTARLGAAIPILMLAMLALTPIFFDLRSLRALQLLLPAYYYLSSVHSPVWILLLALYTVIVFLLGFLLCRLREKP